MTNVTTRTDHANLIINALRVKRLPFTEKNTKSGKRLVLKMTCDNIPNLDVTISIGENGISQISAYTPHHITKENTAAILGVLNDMHNKYRFVTFHLDSDGDICARYDVHIYAESDTLPDVLMHMLRSFTMIVDLGIEAINKELQKDRKEEEFEFFRMNPFDED